MVLSHFEIKNLLHFQNPATTSTDHNAFALGRSTSYSTSPTLTSFPRASTHTRNAVGSFWRISPPPPMNDRPISSRRAATLAASCSVPFFFLLPPERPEPQPIYQICMFFGKIEMFPDRGDEDHDGSEEERGGY